MRLNGCLVLTVCCPSLLFAASTPNDLKAIRISTPPVIDGVIGEDEWKQVPFVEGLHDSNTGAAYVDDGKFWLAYDKDYIYFAARLQEADPHSIHATEYRTNVGLTGDDYVELDLDLSGSLSAFNTFQVNPHGATNIMIAGGRAAKREWLGAFIAKGRITPTGWEAEARIPWRAMDIPKGGRRDVRFNILRFVEKNQRLLSYAFVPMTQTGLTPTWSGVDLPKPEVDHSLKLLPYAYAGYDRSTKGVFNAGLDMKTAVTDQINLVGSINPDFRNIADQILSIDFSRFERLAGESRPFFEEGSQYSNSQVFASQRIASFDAGLNTYGRLSDKSSFSLIDTTRFGKESDTIFNFTEDPNPNTSIRATGTDLEQPGLSNKSYLVRVSQNLGAYNLFLRNMGSQDSTTGSGQQNDLYLNYSKAGLSIMGGWTSADKGFDPRLGFVQEVDLKGPVVVFDFARNFNHGALSDSDFTVYGVDYNHVDGTFYRKEGNVSATATLRPGLNLLAAADIADFEGSHDSLYSFQISYPRGNPYNTVALHLDTGRQAGIPYRSMTVSSAYRVTKKVQFTLREQIVDYPGPSDQTIFSGSYDLGHDRSIAGRLVRQGHETNGYIAYERSGNEGIEYFLIFGDPNAQTFRASLILKVVVPFTLGKRGLDPGAKPTVISQIKPG